MTCYSPSGSVASTDTPCNASQPESHCCSSTDICLNNNYCLTVGDESPNVVQRQSCTDITFQSKYCPYLCNDVTREGASALFMSQFGPPATYCCSGGAADNGTCPSATHNSSEPFAIAPGSIIVNRTSGILWQANLIQLDSLPSAIISTATVSTTAFTTAFTTSLVTVEADAGRAAAIATTGVAVGAGLGIPLLLALAAIIIVWRSMKRKERMYLNEKHDMRQRFQIEDSETLCSATQPRNVSFVELYSHHEHELT